MYKRQIQIIILKYSFLKGFVHSNYIMTFNQAAFLPFFLVFLCFCSDCLDSTHSHCWQSFEVSASCDYFQHYLEQHILSCLQTHWQPTEIASVLAIRITQAVWLALCMSWFLTEIRLCVYICMYVLNLYSTATLTTKVINAFKTWEISAMRLIYDILLWRNDASCNAERTVCNTLYYSVNKDTLNRFILGIKFPFKGWCWRYFIISILPTDSVKIKNS